MAIHWPLCLSLLSILLGFASAAFWLRSSVAKVSSEAAIAQRKRTAEHRGQEPDLGSVSLDGWDMSATFAAQSKWNSLGAICAASSIGLQAISQLLSNV